MADYGLNAYLDNGGVVNLVDFVGDMVVWSKSLTTSGDSSGSYRVPTGLENKCTLSVNTLYDRGASGDKFLDMTNVTFDGTTIRWNLGAFRANGGGYLTLMLTVV